MLRIGAGQFKGKLLRLPPPNLTRPSSDRLRQAIFNILSNHLNFNGLHVLDAFAGSGALGLEAISRGASHGVFCEKDMLVTKILQQNTADTLKQNSPKATLHKDLFQLESAKPFDLVFLDPPYDQWLETQALDHLCQQQILRTKCVVVVEQRKGAQTVEHGRFTHLTALRVYGKCQISFLIRES
jgi:16S rRNA (guanine966-N2)-methyltransferase